MTAATSETVDAGSALELTSGQRLVFGLILQTIHLICDAVTSVIIYFQFLWKLATSWLPPNRSLTFQKISDLSKSTLTKQANHVAFAFLEPTGKMNLDAISEAVVWSWASGATFVSLYDVAGHLKRRQVELLTSIRQSVAKLGGNDSSFSRQFRLEWHPHLESENLPPEGGNVSAQLSPRNGKRNGGGGDMSILREIHLSLLSARDGRLDLVRTARHLAAQASSGQLDIDSIDENLIGQTLSTNRGIPDPDILIRIGLCSSNLGFLPWQTRLTEIYDWPSVATITFRDFFGFLKRFSKCEQRFGR